MLTIAMIINTVKLILISVKILGKTTNKKIEIPVQNIFLDACHP